MNVLNSLKLVSLVKERVLLWHSSALLPHQRGKERI